MGCVPCVKNKVEHFKQRERPKTIPSEQKCDLCDEVSWEVSYCSFCKKWLCPACARDPVKRFKGFSKEVKKKFINKK